MTDLGHGVVIGEAFSAHQVQNDHSATARNSRVTVHERDGRFVSERRGEAGRGGENFFFVFAREVENGNVDVLDVQAFVFIDERFSRRMRGDVEDDVDVDEGVQVRGGALRTYGDGRSNIT